MNTQLKQIYAADIADRNNKIPSEQLNANDKKRLDLVKKILTNSEGLSAQDYHHAALIFHHGEKLEDCKRAHELAIRAVDLGDESARYLAAASLDRSLLMEGQAQKYGTQFKLNDKGEWQLVTPIDPSITDEERTEWNMPPLKAALQVYKQKYNL